MREREKNKAFYEVIESTIDGSTGEIIEHHKYMIAKTSPEPDFIKVYYETMLAFNQVHDIPVSFVLSLARFLEWTNDGKPSVVTMNKRAKEIIAQDCNTSLRQVERYMKDSVKNGLLFKTEYRGVYDVNPFMIAKGKWESIKELRAKFDFKNGKWEREVEIDRETSTD